MKVRGGDSGGAFIKVSLTEDEEGIDEECKIDGWDGKDCSNVSMNGGNLGRG